ncbi:MAG: hypothetical protein AB7I41_14460 [Candidatus Sericytochromatia bacterium]
MFEHLKTLKAAQSQLVQRDDMRMQAARSQYSQAQALLQEYNRSPDKTTLKQCMLLLTGCVRMQRNYAEPYLLLAYIYLALRLPQLSLKYLRVAQHLGSQDPLLGKIQAALQKGFQAPRVQTSRGKIQASQRLSAAFSEETDYDALYEEVQGLLLREVRAAMDIPLPAGPTANPERLNALHRAGHQLSEAIELIQGQLEVLDQEMDCSELYRKLRSLESRLRLLASILEGSEQCVALMQTLNGLAQRVQTALMNPSEQDLETFLDQCDSIADQLDGFTAKGWQIAELEAVYQALIDQITLLQDKLDS